MTFDFGDARLDPVRDRELLVWIFNQFLYGEVTGIQVGHWLYRAPTLDAANFLARQAVEQLQHVDRFIEILGLLSARPGKSHAAVRFLSSGMMGDDWAEHVLPRDGTRRRLCVERALRAHRHARPRRDSRHFREGDTARGASRRVRRVGGRAKPSTTSRGSKAVCSDSLCGHFSGSTFSRARSHAVRPMVIRSSSNSPRSCITFRRRPSFVSSVWRFWKTRFRRWVFCSDRVRWGLLRSGIWRGAYGQGGGRV